MYLRHPSLQLFWKFVFNSPLQNWSLFCNISVTICTIFCFGSSPLHCWIRNNKPLLWEEKKTHFIVVLFQEAALGDVLKSGNKKSKTYIEIQRTWDRGDVSFLRVGVQGQNAMRCIGFLVCRYRHIQNSLANGILMVFVYIIFWAS